MQFLSQSRCDPLELLEVMISTIFPFFSVVSIGTILPFTFAPTHLHPIAEWILNAKSSGVEPAGSSITSPFGVKTNTCWQRDPFSVFPGTLSDLLYPFATLTSDAATQVSLRHFHCLFLDTSSLYFQCALPYSATLCIS